MSILKQKTIQKQIEFSGIGLHTGKEVSLRLNQLYQILVLFLEE